MSRYRAPSHRHLLAEAGERGMTWREYAALSGAHHGSASGALSKMHERGTAERLVEQREGIAVYVAPEFVHGRPTLPRKRRVVAADGTLKTVAIERPEVDVPVLLDAMEAVADLQRAAEQIELEAIHAAEVARLTDLLHDLEVKKEALEVEVADRDALLEEARVTAHRVKRATSDRERRVVQRHAKELAKAVADVTAEMTAKLRDEAEAEVWQDGYDAGLKRGEESTRSGGFEEGLIAGRIEGEEMVKRRVGAVVLEMNRAIMERTPVRGHFQGCYKVHPDCAVKAIARSAGIQPRPMGTVPNKLGATG